MKTLLERINEILKETDHLHERSSPDDHYTEFFNKKLKEYGVKSPDELSKKKRKQFFDEIEKS